MFIYIITKQVSITASRHIEINFKRIRVALSEEIGVRRVELKYIVIVIDC